MKYQNNRIKSRNKRNKRNISRKKRNISRKKRKSNHKKYGGAISSGIRKRREDLPDIFETIAEENKTLIEENEKLKEENETLKEKITKYEEMFSSQMKNMIDENSETITSIENRGKNAAARLLERRKSKSKSIPAPPTSGTPNPRNKKLLDDIDEGSELPDEGPDNFSIPVDSETPIQTTKGNPSLFLLGSMGDSSRRSRRRREGWKTK